MSTYHGLLVLGLHGLGDFTHLDGGRGRAAETNTPPPLPYKICLGRQLDSTQERPQRADTRIISFVFDVGVLGVKSWLVLVYVFVVGGD